MSKITFKDIFWVLLSGVMATLPFLSFSLAPLIWVALVPLICTVSGKGIREGVILGFIAGAIFGYGGMYWLKNVTGLGYLLIGLYLAFYWGVWGGWISFVSQRRPGWVWWAAPVFWVSLEFLRSYLFTGFPWNLLGVSQAKNLPLIQIASITGVYGISFVVVLVNSACAQLLIALYNPIPQRTQRFSRWCPPVSTFLILIAVILYGRGELDKGRKSGGQTTCLALCLVQGGVAQELKWEPSLAGAHFRTYLNLTREALASRPDLVVWPESALPFYLEEREKEKKILSNMAQEGQLYLLVGGDYRTASSPVRYHNSAYLFGPDGVVQGRYDKVHLVPYGEYTPLKRFLPFLKHVVPWEEDFSAGESISLFKMGDIPHPPGRSLNLGVLICYEDIFPGLVRDFVRRGAGLLANITNDAWYGRTVAPFQHAYNALFRSVENRIYLGRSTNTGYSCVIDPWGRVVGEVVDEGGRSLFVSGWTTVEIFLEDRGSFYTAHGDLFCWLCVIMVVISWAGCILITKGKSIGGVMG